MSLNTVPAVAPQLEGDQGSSVAGYRTYTEAQDTVDYLSDHGFPVRDVSIVGHGLTSVEQVTGRMTKSRAALTGAATGAWIGLLLGLLFSVFIPGLVWFTVLGTSILTGAAWGAAIGFLAHWETLGRRDFSSRHGLVAERYDVMVHDEAAAEARRVLATRQDR